MTRTFFRSDSWLLLTLGSFGEHGGTLADILSRGDNLNHAIFNREELRGGLERFLRSGYAIERDGRFMIHGAALIFSNSLVGKGIKELWNEFHDFLDVDPDVHEDTTLIDMDSTCPALSDNAIEAGYALWRQQSANVLEQAMAYIRKKLV